MDPIAVSEELEQMVDAANQAAVAAVVEQQQQYQQQAEAAQPADYETASIGSRASSDMWQRYGRRIYVRNGTPEQPLLREIPGGFVQAYVKVVSPHFNLLHMCGDDLRQVAISGHHAVAPKLVTSMNDLIFESVPSLHNFVPASLPTTQVRLGSSGSFVQCHTFVLQAALQSMQRSHSIASVESFVHDISQLQCSPELVRCFLLGCYHGLTGDDRTRIVPMKIALRLVTRLLNGDGVRLASDVCSFRKGSNLMEVLAWLAFVDSTWPPHCKSTLATVRTVLAYLLYVRTKSDDVQDGYDDSILIASVCDKIEADVPGWRAKSLHKFLVPYLTGYNAESHTMINWTRAERRRGGADRTDVTSFIHWQDAFLKYTTQTIFQLPELYVPPPLYRDGKMVQHFSSPLVNHPLGVLPPSDFNVNLFVAGEDEEGPFDMKYTFQVHSWIMIQWAFFRQMLSAGMSETATSSMDFNSDQMSYSLLATVLASLYGADVYSPQLAHICRANDASDLSLLQNAEILMLVPRTNQTNESNSSDTVTHDEASSSAPQPSSSNQVHAEESLQSKGQSQRKDVHPRFETTMMYLCGNLFDTHCSKEAVQPRWRPRDSKPSGYYTPSDSE